jgi:molybdenum cofactor biosynthesis protein B
MPPHDHGHGHSHGHGHAHEQPAAQTADRVAREHRRHGPAEVRAAVVTVSDSRTPDTDDSGNWLAAALRGAGHTVVAHHIVKDDPAAITSLVRELIAAGAQAVITNGGTGISRRDTTYEAVERLLEKKLDGFGELFRMLSYQEIGAAAMLSRAVAGVAGPAVLFALPGSPAAVKLGTEKLILPELGHMVFLAERDLHRPDPAAPGHGHAAKAK